MARITKWHDVHGVFAVEITHELIEELNAECAEALRPYIAYVPYNLIIEFNSSGSHDPGRTYGDPYYCYPPETSEDRSLAAAYVEGGDQFELPANVQQALFDHFAADIDEVDLPRY